VYKRQVENYETGNVLFFKPEQNLELNQNYYFSVIPFNENGEALGCSEEQFTTGEPTIRCEEIDFPILSFPDVISLCRGSDFSSIRTDSRARGYRWIKINTNGEEEIISEINEFEYNEAGTYRLELYNIITEFGASIECPVVKEFEVVYSEEPIIQDVLVSRQTNGLRIEIRVESSGNFEYSLTNEISGYQDSPIFYNVPPGERKVYVRDKNGCGITQRLVEKELSADDFPAFFTPNGDGNNDYWQYKKNEGSAELNIEYIQIYDRYGNFLAQVNPLSKGWSGTYQGRELPESDYWFKAISFSQKEIKGHFTLKR